MTVRIIAHGVIPLTPSKLLNLMRFGKVLMLCLLLLVSLVEDRKYTLGVILFEQGANYKVWMSRQLRCEKGTPSTTASATKRSVVCPHRPPLLPLRQAGAVTTCRPSCPATIGR